jgi:hypothetical protein
VKFHGIIDEAVLVSGGRAVTFLADPGAELTRSTGNGAIVTVQDDQTSLSVYDLSISNAPNSSSGIGCLIPAGAGAPTLSLTRVSIANNPGGGIVTAVGVAAVMQSSIVDNQNGGVSSSGGMLSVVQSRISGNRGGGIYLFGGVFVIVGNVFFDNGWLMSTVGGISITTTASSESRLDFNSFALNTSQDGVGPAIQCIAAAFTAKNNIMSDNRTSSLVANQFGGACMHAYTIARPGTLPPGIGNGISDPLFVAPARGDLHLQANSPARRAADPASDLNGIASHDIDGNARVAPADIGAYQFR